MSDFSWLQFSDLHLIPHEGFDPTAAKDALLRTLSSSDFPNYDYVFIIGDVANKGDYSAVNEWLSLLISRLRVDNDKVFWAVGNHDIDRRILLRKSAISAIRNASDSHSYFEELISDKQAKKC